MTAILITGEETFLVHEEISRRMHAFAKKNWSDNVHVYTSENRDEQKIASDLFWQSLFASPKLIVLYGIADNHSSYKLKVAQTENITEILMTQRQTLNTDNYLLFVVHKPDKRTKTRKFLDKNIEKKKDYKLLTTASAKKYIQWLLWHSWDLWKTTKETLLQLIVEIVWTEAWRLSSEIKKLLLYLSSQKAENIEWLDEQKETEIVLTEDIIRQVCYWAVSDTVFVLIDTLVAGRYTESITLLDGINKTWTNRNEVFGGLYRNIKLMIMYTEQLSLGTNKKSIAKAIAAPPFTIMKREKHSKRLIQQHDIWKQLLHEMVVFEYDVKTWKQSDISAFLLLKRFIYQYFIWK